MISTPQIPPNFLALMLGKERLKHEQVEENLEPHETYEKLVEQNKSYHNGVSRGCRAKVAVQFIPITTKKNGRISRWLR